MIVHRLLSLLPIDTVLRVCRGWEANDITILLKHFITGVTVLVVAVPEGLPLVCEVLAPRPLPVFHMQPR